MSLYCGSRSPAQPENPTGYLCEQREGHIGPHTRIVMKGGTRTLSWGGFNRPEAYCRRPKGHTGKCAVDPIAQPGDVAQQHNPPPSEPVERCDKPDTVHSVTCYLPQGHAGVHQWEGQISTAWEDAEEPESELQQDLRKFHVRGEDGNCRDDAQTWPCNTAISWITHGAQPIDTAEDENTAQADAEAAWEAYQQRMSLPDEHHAKGPFIAGYMAALPEWNG